MERIAVPRCVRACVRIDVDWTVLPYAASAAALRLAENPGC